MGTRHVSIAENRVSCMLIQENVSLDPVWRWLAVLLWMSAIFAVSSFPTIATPFEAGFDFSLKKLAHVVEYGVLTVLLFSALRLHIALKRHALFSAALVAIVYACSDEWHQSFVPGREGRLRDVGIDAVGALVASLW